MITTTEKRFDNAQEIIKYIDTLKAKREKKLQKKSIYVCVGTGCTASGSRKVYAKFVDVIKQKGLDVAIEKIDDDDEPVKRTGCCGLCSLGPLVKVMPSGITYSHVTVDDVEEIIEKTLINGEPIERLLLTDPISHQKVERLEDATFFKNQTFYIMNEIGKSECESIEDYMARGGYLSLAKALSMDRKEIIEIIKASGLRGRGGGGFPTGLKWEAAYNSKGDIKYIVCNADEGDPGAFMNRTLLERDPHSVLEGMIIAAYAIGAQEGYAYIRAEYPIAVEMFNKAIESAKEYGLLGDNILGTDFSLDIHVKEGAGAFVCGEETALLSSIEGKRGTPRPRPPFPAQAGLWGKPTLINNVETYGNVAKILRDGVESYRTRGVQKSPGTKMFSVTGPLNLTGIIEVQFGTTLRYILENICGGTSNGRRIKAIQIGGPSGACLPEELFDLPLDYDTLKSVGAMVGSGGIVAITDDRCMVEVARFFLDFTKRESCGKCVPCREGTMQAYNILEKFTQGKATYEDLETLEYVSEIVRTASLCGLGKTAPNPIISTLKYFKEEYIEHIEGKCPSGMCTAFKKYIISPEKCKSCSLCARSCPNGAISGERGKPYVIDQDKCVKCGLCVTKCKFGAIELVG
ncbi:MAG TPA: NADH-quinone oxidoreductase subunit NuoF [Fervidobacterium sp.]|jgi:iron-hydrogenase subunit beta|nr:NADH-quinone oxidoreductase subunit NuoF [Thermotogaceae bacterium]HOK33566.1 NADH-quinone oxidoreductase subunit NuoF [Fervidobacterium sp.]HON03879.1 NADH-quinone oxidoreductase subunit NuoF [Fervidobacterium sp.]HOP82076.1 NADH-quinone oxidoreductase subunit NuoF [Fervidobacterium sp.]HOS52039.1 NADH-quinone oxidoreductase subunit NuoF [Fervidobacterium sp.]